MRRKYKIPPKVVPGGLDALQIDSMWATRDEVASFNAIMREQRDTIVRMQSQIAQIIIRLSGLGIDIIGPVGPQGEIGPPGAPGLPGELQDLDTTCSIGNETAYDIHSSGVITADDGFITNSDAYISGAIHGAIEHVPEYGAFVVKS